jgi:hypothetical protein
MRVDTEPAVAFGNAEPRTLRYILDRPGDLIVLEGWHQVLESASKESEPVTLGEDLVCLERHWPQRNHEMD